MEFTVSCKAPAVFVSLESSILGNFSSSGFALTPWDHQAVTFTADKDVSSADVEDNLTMQSLFSR